MNAFMNVVSNVNACAGEPELPVLEGPRTWAPQRPALRPDPGSVLLVLVSGDSQQALILLSPSSLALAAASRLRSRSNRCCVSWRRWSRGGRRSSGSWDGRGLPEPHPAAGAILAVGCLQGTGWVSMRDKGFLCRPQGHWRDRRASESTVAAGSRPGDAAIMLHCPVWGNVSSLVAAAANTPSAADMPPELPPLYR